MAYSVCTYTNKTINYLSSCNNTYAIQDHRLNTGVNWIRDMSIGVSYNANACVSAYQWNCSCVSSQTTVSTICLCCQWPIVMWRSSKSNVCVYKAGSYYSCSFATNYYICAKKPNDLNCISSDSFLFTLAYKTNETCSYFTNCYSTTFYHTCDIDCGYKYFCFSVFRVGYDNNGNKKTLYSYSHNYSNDDWGTSGYYGGATNFINTCYVVNTSQTYSYSNTGYNNCSSTMQTTTQSGSTVTNWFTTMSNSTCNNCNHGLVCKLICTFINNKTYSTSNGMHYYWSSGICCKMSCCSYYNGMTCFKTGAYEKYTYTQWNSYVGQMVDFAREAGFAQSLRLSHFSSGEDLKPNQGYGVGAMWLDLGDDVRVDYDMCLCGSNNVIHSLYFTMNTPNSELYYGFDVRCGTNSFKKYGGITVDTVIQKDNLTKLQGNVISNVDLNSCYCNGCGVLILYAFENNDMIKPKLNILNLCGLVSTSNPQLCGIDTENTVCGGIFAYTVCLGCVCSY